MNSTEKDNIIQKAICCSGAMGKTVADLYIKGSKCADKEFQKLFLLVSYIETLGCYNAPLDTTTYAVVSGNTIETTVVTTEYTNCLTEDEADNIATQISKLCDLCDSH